MSNPTALAGVRLKIERAKHHIRDFEIRKQMFFEAHPYFVTADEEPETGDKVFRVKIVWDIPNDMPLLVGDAIHNLRTALDHLAYQLVLANKNVPTKATYFPIAESIDKYKASSAGKVQGMSPSAIQAIDAAKPYQGGNDQFWVLHELDNFDKHRLLVPIATVNTAMIHDFGPTFRVMLAGMRAATGDPIAGFPDDFSWPFTFRPKDMTPLKDHAEIGRICRAARGPHVDENQKFTFDVAFGEPQVVEGKAVLESLHQLSQFVDGVIASFERFFI